MRPQRGMPEIWRWCTHSYFRVFDSRKCPASRIGNAAKARLGDCTAIYRSAISQACFCRIPDTRRRALSGIKNSKVRMRAPSPNLRHPPLRPHQSPPLPHFALIRQPMIYHAPHSAVSTAFLMHSTKQYVRATPCNARRAVRTRGIERVWGISKSLIAPLLLPVALPPIHAFISS